MNILKSWPLKNSLQIAMVDEFDSAVLDDQIKKYLTPEYPIIPASQGMNAEAKAKFKALRANLANRYELKLVILDGQQIVAWTHGWQDSIEQDSFFMGGSLVIPTYRRQGLYQELISKVFEITAEVGFQSVSSLHVLTNNAVIIAKLKMEFNIYGVEVNTRYGALVRLVYHHSELKRKALRFRAGAVHETEIQALLGSF